MKRVRIFIDHQNFTIGWRKMPGFGSHYIRWERLPQLVVKELERRQFVESGSADLRGVTVYASVDPKKGCAAGSEHHFLRYELDQLPGYTVRISDRQERQCEHDANVIHTVEKGVDTKIVCDMLALAMRDHYDLGVIISDDSDLVPSVQCVQDILDRQIVHLGFRDSLCREMRSAAWGHMTLDSIAAGLRGPQANGASAAAGKQLEKALTNAFRGGGGGRRRRKKRAAVGAPAESSPLPPPAQA